MFGPSFNDYYRKALETFNQDILRESDEQILGSDADELANYYHQKYALVPIEFNPADIAYEIKKEVRNVPAERREFGYGSGDTDWEYEVAYISIPIDSITNVNLDWVQKLSSLGPHTLDGFEDEILYSPNEIIYSFDTKWYGGRMEEDKIANEVNSKSRRLIEVLTGKNSDIRSENDKFLQAIKNIILQRETKLNADKEKLNTLTQKINIPLKQKAVPGATKIHVDVKKFVQFVKPAPKLPAAIYLRRIYPQRDFGLC